MERDQGDIVLGWLTRLIVVMSFLGIAGFDAVSILTTRVQVTDQANFAARAASESWGRDGSVQAAYNAAATEAQKRSALNELPVEGFAIDPDGTVHLRLERTATTLVIERIGAAAEWAEVSGTGTGRFVQ